MDEDRIWQAIDGQRRAVAHLLEGLTADEWRSPSLCEGWTVRDVAAHLTLQQLGLGDALGMMARWPGGMNRMIREAARRRAGARDDELIAAIRGTIGSRRHNIGVTCRETLIDILVHAQDIAVPLGRSLATPPEPAAVAADRVWERGWPFRARTRFAGFRLTATDTTWSVGEGAEIHGTAGALLLLLTGRAAALPMVSGEGIDRLAERVSAGR